MIDEIEYDPPVSVKAGQIQFVEACHPPLVAGGYTAIARQVVKESEQTEIPWNADPYTAELHFAVDAPRFTLDPADIHSVYPPANPSGRYDNTLPHVVLTRRTLPWERTLDGRPPKLGQPFPPWMGLLLVQEDELLIPDSTGRTTSRKHEVRSLPVASKGGDSLLFPHPEKEPPGSVLAPDLGQPPSAMGSDEENRYKNDFCLALDLPAELFKAVAPRIEDLPYLAHVRQMDTGEKEVQAVNDRGWFSLVVGNRLPQPGKDHRALLVSLEGHRDRLEESWQPRSGQHVRLAVLGAWGFKCEGSNDFKGHMKGLTLDSLHLPFSPYSDQSTEAQDIVNAAYARGYTAFNHIMRQGERTVSWYRGPLAPLNHDKPRQIQETASCADELLRYDPDTGLFDVTYAAAWQLGRLLALQNHSFALALSRARKVLRQEAEEGLRRSEVSTMRKALDLERGGCLEQSLMSTLSKGLGERLLKAVPTSSSSSVNDD
ncbi:MAG: hypothetical protein MUC41_02815 [Syntrophobacteraceae bacterium]|jgi:hypothetical protein|nr:hypothetical protein [Syntrophobacteraceae bacterium]